jgi:hypothetical protein
VREHRQHHRVDPVGLAGQRRQPLDLLGIGYLDRPTLLLERVVHQPGAGHRLDHGADGPAMNFIDAPRQCPQRVCVGRNGELVQVLALLVENTDVDLASTEIQASVQH